jgi:hypothetical protein
MSPFPAPNNRYSCRINNILYLTYRHFAPICDNSRHDSPPRRQLAHIRRLGSVICSIKNAKALDG